MTEPDITPAPIEIKRWGRDAVKLNTGQRDRILPLGGLDHDQVNWARACAELSMELPVLRDLVRSYLARTSSDAARRENEAPSVRLYARGAKQRREHGRAWNELTEDNLREALETGLEYLEWPGGSDTLACLDIDFHGSDTPEWVAVQSAVLAGGVRPSALWRSMSGGAHALYWAMEGFTASEIAAAVAVELCGSYAIRDATFEVLTRSRIPSDPVTFYAQEIQGILRSWRSRDLRTPTEEEVMDYRAEKDWQGRDATHDQCPGDPDHQSSKPGSRPVFFAQRGVSCLSCKARGLRSFWTWSELIDGTEYRVNKVRQCAEYLTDWTHASFVLADEVGGRIVKEDQRRAYFALCKLLHDPEDPRVTRLARDRDGDFIRGVGCWLDPLTMSIITPRRDYFRTLPSNQYVRDDGSTGIKTSAVERCMASGELPGYPPVIPVRGIQLWGQFMEYPSMENAVRVPNFRGSHEPPRYVDSDRDVEAAWAELLPRFPGLKRNYLELLLVARGAAESGAGKVPRIIVTGPSGSAKSTTVHLAAAMIGEDCANVPWSNQKSFREIFDDAVLNTAGFILCDEFAKPTPGRKKTPGVGNPFSMFLGMESRTHKTRVLYVGPVTVQNLSAVIVTGVQIAHELQEDKQLQRRFIHVPLHTQTPERWEKVCGFNDVANVRQALPRVCDVILSDIVDRFFTMPDPSLFDWEEAATSLGFTLLCDSPDLVAVPSEADDDAGDLPFRCRGPAYDAFSAAARVQRLYALVSIGEACEDPPARFRARGRRRFGVFDETEVAKTYRSLCDGLDETSSRLSSERIMELDLRAVLGVTRDPGEPVWCEIKGDWNSVCLRFGVGSKRKPLAVNRELMED